MKLLTIIPFLLVSMFPDNTQKMSFSETEILQQFDMAASNIPAPFFPEKKAGDIQYNFFLDLEDGYLVAAGNRIHLYADATRWAVVFEQNGYHTRSSSAEIQLIFVGNCINYPVDKYPERSYISNQANIPLITAEEFNRIENKKGSNMETFEFIGKNTKDIKVRDTTIIFENDYRKYEQLGIGIKDDDNPQNLISFGNLVRYIHETNPGLISAREEDIRTHIPGDLPKLMSIDQFHFMSLYQDGNPLSQQETYQLIAKVLVTRDTAFWKPVLKANNHWSNWESGQL